MGGEAKVTPLSFGLFLVLTLLLGYIGFAESGFDERSEKKIGKVPSSCELNRDGYLRQPANALSSLSITIVGLVILHRAGKMPVQSSANYSARQVSPYCELTLETNIYAFLTILVGMGAFYAHGSMTVFGQHFDRIAMAAWILLPLTYAAMRAFSRGRLFHHLAWSISSVSSAWLMLNLDKFGITDLYFILVPIWIGLEIIAHLRNGNGINRNTLIGSLLFLFAYASRSLGTKGAETCASESLLQGHALWHIFCAVVIWFFWLHLQSVSPSNIDEEITQ